MHTRLYLVGLVFLIGSPRLASAIDSSRGPYGANHLAAHRYATGAGTTVGILDVPPSGMRDDNYLGNRLVDRREFRGLTPSQIPGPIVDHADDHETLVADVVASNDSFYLGVAPAANIFDAAVYEYDSYRAATNWMDAHHQIRLFNMSGNYDYNDNGQNEMARYFDWFIHDRDALLVISAGNFYPEILKPADFYNGITAGAMNDFDQSRWSSSAYQIIDPVGGTEVRGKPDLLAPGVNTRDGLSYSGGLISGTSFAAPHVVGTAALLTDYSNQYLTVDTLDHRGLKAILMNSTRKREIVAPETLSSVSYDNTVPHPLYDRDYLDCTLSSCTLNTAALPATTTSWTPSGWSFSAGRFSVSKPLDDEQGTGFLDSTRAIVNLAGGNFGPGPVGGIGWDQDEILPADSPTAHVYTLNQTIAAGSFLTATLAWDRIILESDGDGSIDDDDTYAIGELANLDLQILNSANQIVAESISTADNVEHLHFPFLAAGNPGDYKLQVIYNGGSTLATDFALAWWTDLSPLVPGDYNLDGAVDAADYIVWRNNVATSRATSPLIYGDGDNNGTVDAADFAIWKNHFGQTWSAGAGSGAFVAVPEAPAILLALMAFTGSHGLRLRTRRVVD
jgi:Subtilase family/Dockerin type I domain